MLKTLKMKKEKQHIDLFEDYENIPANVQKVLDKYEEAFMDGAYDGLLKAHKAVNKLGYTFEYYLDGQAYGLRPNDVPLNKLKGYEDEPDEMAKGGNIDNEVMQEINKWMIISHLFDENPDTGRPISDSKFKKISKEIYAEWYSSKDNYTDIKQYFNQLEENGDYQMFLFEKGGEIENFYVYGKFDEDRKWQPIKKFTFEKEAKDFISKIVVKGVSIGGFSMKFDDYKISKIKSKNWEDNEISQMEKGGSVEDSGLMVIGRTTIDNTRIGDIIEQNDFYAEWNTREGFWFFPEEVENYDELEQQLEELFIEEGINARFEGIFAKGGSVGNLTMMIWFEFTTTSDSIDLEDKELKNEFLELSSIQKEDDYKYSATALSRNSLWKEFSNQTSKQFKDELQRKLKELVNSKTNNKVVVKSIKIPRGASMQKGGSIDKIKKGDSVYYIRQYTAGKIVGKVIDIDEDGMYAKVRNTIGNIDYVPVNALKKYVKQELSNYPNKTVTADVIDNVYEWVGLDFSKKQIKEVFDAIEEYTGYEYPKSFKTNASPFNDFEPAHKKVNEVVNSLSIAALEGDDLTKSNIRDIIWGIVMSAHNKMANGGEVDEIQPMGRKHKDAVEYGKKLVDKGANHIEVRNKLEEHYPGLKSEMQNVINDILDYKESKMATGGEVEDFNDLIGKWVSLYSIGVEEPASFTIKSVKVTPENYTHRDLTIKLSSDSEEKIPLKKAFDFVNGKTIVLNNSKGEKYALQLLKKYATGGEVLGRNIKFTDYNGETRNGVITESLDGGNFAVSSGFGSVLVTPEMVISFDEKPQESKRKLFGFFEEGGNINTEIVTIYVNDYPYYLKKGGDTTHLYMSNSREGIDLVIPSHIGQYNGTPYYTDIRSWLKGGESPNGKKYTETFKDGGKIESKPDKKFLNKISSKVDKVWDAIGAQSGGQIRSNKEMLADYATKSLIEVEKLGLKKNSLTENDFKHFQNRNDHLLNEFLIWNDFFVNNFAEKEKASFVALFKDYPNGYADPSIIKVVTNDEMYIPHSKIQSITVLIDGKEVLINGKHILNGANR